MRVANKINPSIIAAATGMLQPFVPELSPQTLVKALEEYRATDTANASPFTKPITRKEAAELLDVSLPTINRLLNQGRLQRIKITAGCVRIDSASVKALLQPANDVEVEH